MKKESKHNLLGYRGEDDRCYGLAGMSVSLASLDALDQVASVSIDYPGPMIRFTGEFYYGGSPSVSPKATWHRLMENYRLTTSLAICNVLARCAFRDGGTDPTDMLDELWPIIRAEGAEACALEDDEIDSLLSNTLTRARRIFGNHRLLQLLPPLAEAIRSERELSGRALAEHLHLLRLI